CVKTEGPHFHSAGSRAIHCYGDGPSPPGKLLPLSLCPVSRLLTWRCQAISSYFLSRRDLHYSRAGGEAGEPRVPRLVLVEVVVKESLSVAAVARAAWHDFLRARWPLILFDVLFKFGEAWLWVPAVAVLLAAVLSRAGHVALSNRDVFDFLL